LSTYAKPLNRRLLVDREDGRVIRRIDIQPNHVRGLVEVRVIRLHVPLEPMRLQARALPRFRDQIVMVPEQATQGQRKATAPAPCSVTFVAPRGGLIDQLRLPFTKRFSFRPR